MTGADSDPKAKATARSLERGRLLFARECRFVSGAVKMDGLPPAALPEVAFCGRSNVGKSSLINALTSRNTLARISRTPGRTRQINFFSLDGKLMLVDLPGFGFARAPKRHIEQWTELTGNYLTGRVNLRRLCLLVDARHGLKDIDRAVMAHLDTAAVSYQIVLTKADKVMEDALTERVKTLEAELVKHAAAIPGALITSAHAGTGIPELRAALAGLAGPTGDS